MSLHQETVFISGHIIYSLLLAKVLDIILLIGGAFDLKDMRIGKMRTEPSRARIVIRATSAALLDDILKMIQPYDAPIEPDADCRRTSLMDDQSDSLDRQHQGDGNLRRGVKQGIIAACLRQGVLVVIAGIIRDDGPLPSVITDSDHSQNDMPAAIPGVGLSLSVASTLHSVATSNLSPATVPTVCVDVNPSVPTKQANRGSFQVVGLVMDAVSFLSELARMLERPV